MAEEALRQRGCCARSWKCVILQKSVTHYREPVFAELFRRFKWIVISADALPNNQGFRFVEKAEFCASIPSRVLVRHPRVIDLSVTRALRRLRPDVVLAEFSMYLTSTYKLAAMRVVLGWPKLVFYTHGYNMERRHDRLRDRAMDWLRRQVIDRADAIACYSEEGRAFLARDLRAEKVFVARNTIDVGPMRALRRTTEPLRHGPGPHLLGVGRMTGDKRFPALVTAFREVLRAVPDAHLTIVGDGPDMPAVRAAAGELLGVSVHLPGLVYDEPDLAPWFMGADLFVLAGAAGLSVNHALAYGLPVLAFCRTAKGPFHHPEICYVIEGVTGWLVDGFCDRAFAARLVEVLQDSLRPRERLGAAIDRYVDENITLDHLVDDLRRIVEHVAASDPPARGLVPRLSRRTRRSEWAS